jgi:UDP-N-acetylmuramate dehydrogenase
VTALYTDILKMSGIKPEHCRLNAPLKDLNHFKCGGSADVLVFPETEAQLKSLLQNINRGKVPFFILGGGSNLLISDFGIEGFVIGLKHLIKETAYARPDGKEAVMVFSAARNTSDIAWESARHGFKGAHNFYGLPGTLGGACYMNARCYGNEIADIFMSARCLNDKGDEVIITKNDKDWDYKKSPFQNKALIILEVSLKLEYCGQSDELMTETAGFLQDRESKGHFTYPSGGSTFKNNRSFGKPSGQIIDSLNLKGYSIGGAAVSPHHANFIVNKNNASASEIAALIAAVQQQVKEAYGYELEPEVMPVGRLQPPCTRS